MTRSSTGTLLKTILNLAAWVLIEDRRFRTRPFCHSA